MHLLDWLLLSLPLLGLLFVAYYTKKYMRGVADYLSGGRMAGRYLLAIARGEMGSGAVVFVAMFEIISKSGFAIGWWNWLLGPFYLVLGISGWVIYRFRETRALTLAQFFEIRYSKSFRVFAGVLGICAGLVNFGIIPVVGARFLMFFMGLPRSFSAFGHEVETYILLMAILLSITLALTISGGTITLLVTNCIEGMLSQVLFLVVIVSLFMMFSWSEINTVLVHQPPGQSLLNPFDSFGTKDFNIWFPLIMLWSVMYRTMAWQNQSAFNTAAVTAHESRMGGIMGQWKGMGSGAIITLLTICAMTYLAHPHFAPQAAAVRAEVAQINQVQIQQQMTIPITIEHMLPTGIKGALCIILLLGVFGCDGNHLHSWGSLFIQDILVPLRKQPFTPKEHIRLLRLAMAGVAVFAFCFGCLFRQTEYVVMWFMVTEALFVGGAGVAIIGGLYWKKGTTAGAWAGTIGGSALITSGIIARQIWGDGFPLNGAQIGFSGSIAACLIYAVVSLLTCRENFNMDRMLHRGIYAVESEKKFQTRSEKKITWGKLIGMDDNFTRGDRFLAGGLFAWGLLWTVVAIVGTVWYLAAPWPIAVWSQFWHIVGIGIPVFFAVVTAVWFTWGGVRDIREFFRRLREERIDAYDDGTVVNHQNLSDEK